MWRTHYRILNNVLDNPVYYASGTKEETLILGQYNDENAVITNKNIKLSPCLIKNHNIKTYKRMTV